MDSGTHAEKLASSQARLQESEAFHQGIGRVHKTLRMLAKSLDKLGVEYAIIGGMALNAHGYRRQTTNVDVLVSRDGLEVMLCELVPGNVKQSMVEPPRYAHPNTQVPIGLLVTGAFPGNNKAKPIAFPDPAAASVEIDGIRYISLPKLIELKLASGMTNPGRLRDLADVQELIRVLKLPADFSVQLHPYVQDKFKELHTALQEDPT